VLDRLVREAALVEEDGALARKVMARIDRSAARPSLPRFLVAPAGIAACAAAVLVAAVAGYQVARLEDQSQDSEPLALASGERLPDDGSSAIIPDPGEEDSL
jgi:hypothetical protein